MRCCVLLLGGALLLAPAAQAEQTAGTTVLDHWDAAFLQGVRAGYVHSWTVELDKDGQKLLQSIVDQNLSVKRFNDTIQLRMDTGTTETEDGRVVGVYTRQYLGKKQTLDITGKVEGEELKLFLDKSKPLPPARWDDRVVGQYRQQLLFRDKKVKPGDRFQYLSFEPSVSLVILLRVEVKDYEEVAIPGSKTKRRLLRVETRADKIKDNQGQELELPALTQWLDNDYQVVQSFFQLPGLGDLVLVRTTKDQALAAPGVAKLPDIGVSQYVRLNKTIANPYDTKAAVFRITVKDDKDPASAFSRDDRQEARNSKGSTFDLAVRALRGPGQGTPGTKPGPEFTESSYFINCNDPLIKSLAQKAVGAETDPWKKALRIEKWVNQAMKYQTHEAFATSDHVARTLEGDCTEFGVLTAALCRAVGIPSRTALGLIYADTRQGPVLAFHMWAEVWINGRWLALDGTLGKGYVGATHLKITDHSWHEERGLLPLLGVLRLLGRMQAEVVSVEGSP